MENAKQPLDEETLWKTIMITQNPFSTALP